jgi:hypothetical protein
MFSETAIALELAEQRLTSKQDKPSPSARKLRLGQ